MTLKPAWSWVAPRLASLYHRGLLVPFIGAGLSRPTCAPWSELVRALEEAAGTGAGEGNDSDALVRRANRAVVALRHRGDGALVDAVRNALRTSDGVELPAATTRLASVWWPLVITTNYDDLYAAAVEDRWDRRPLILGRTPMHCFQVGRALREPVPPVIWAIQGFLDTPCSRGFDADGTLSSELVVGHEEYRRVTHREIHFRRAFAEVYRNRSLLFVGSGLKERYFLDLFSEIRETFGPNSQLHYAFAPKGELDVDFLLREFQIAVVEYPTRKGHAALVNRLEGLAAEIERVPVPSRWDFRIESSGGTPSTFAVEQSPLPFGSTEAGSCIAVSADRSFDRMLILGPQIEAEIRALGVDPHIRAPGSVVRFPGKDLFAVVARGRNGRRSLSSVYWGTRDLLRAVREKGFNKVRAQLLACGPGLRPGEDSRPPYRPVHALSEMAAAFGDFVRGEADGSTLDMTVHVIDAGVAGELHRGRLNLQEHLSCIDLRVWVSIELPDRPPTYHVVHVPADEFSGSEPPDSARSMTLGALARSFSVPETWRVDVWPSPGTTWKPGTVRQLRRVPVIFAAVAGSTIQFTAPPAKT